MGARRTGLKTTAVGVGLAGAQPWYRYWGGPNVSPPPDIFFKFSRGSDRKNKQARPSTNE